MARLLLSTYENTEVAGVVNPWQAAFNAAQAGDPCNVLVIDKAIHATRAATYINSGNEQTLIIENAGFAIKASVPAGIIWRFQNLQRVVWRDLVLYGDAGSTHDCSEVGFLFSECKQVNLSNLGVYGMSVDGAAGDLFRINLSAYSIRDGDFRGNRNQNGATLAIRSPRGQGIIQNCRFVDLHGQPAFPSKSNDSLAWIGFYDGHAYPFTGALYGSDGCGPQIVDGCRFDEACFTAVAAKATTVGYRLAHLIVQNVAHYSRGSGTTRAVWAQQCERVEVRGVQLFSHQAHNAIDVSDCRDVSVEDVAYIKASAAYVPTVGVAATVQSALVAPGRFDGPGAVRLRSQAATLATRNDGA